MRKQYTVKNNLQYHCDVKGGFGKALSKKGLGNIIVRMVLRAGRRVSREQLKQDPRTTAYTG
jgi:hypothetical protein